MKIFVSHEHEDAEELEKLKAQMAYYGIDLFLAGLPGVGIQSGTRWSSVLKQELRNCHAILHIGNKKSKESNFCDQELGFALALGKTVIPVLTDKMYNSPWGFISGIQAIKCDGVNDLKFHILKDEFFNNIVEESKRKLKEILKVEGFYISNSYKEGHLTLVPSNWDDMKYNTKFKMLQNNSHIADVKIGYNGQAECNHTKDRLLGWFAHLGENMFSTIRYNSCLATDEKELINSSLNCFALCSLSANKITYSYEIVNSDQYNRLKGQGVVDLSLMREDFW